MDLATELSSASSMPVYGLDDAFSGHRYLDTWNRLPTVGGQVWQVALGHGDWRSPERLVVLTIAKLPAQSLPHGSVGPTGLRDARRLALLEMIAMAAPADAADKRDLLRRASWGDAAFEQADVTVTIDGISRVLPLASHRAASATYVELDQVAIAAYSKAGALDGMSVLPVNDRLADYELLGPEPSTNDRVE